MFSVEFARNCRLASGTTVTAEASMLDACRCCRPAMRPATSSIRRESPIRDEGLYAPGGVMNASPSRSRTARKSPPRNRSGQDAHSIVATQVTVDSIAPLAHGMCTIPVNEQSERAARQC